MWFKFAATPAVWPYNASLRTHLYNMGIKQRKHYTHHQDRQHTTLSLFDYPQL
jgi:hypothetical protein